MPAASEIGYAAKSNDVENAKKNLFERMWSTSRQDYVKRLACERLAQLCLQSGVGNDEKDAIE